jgi:iron complex outermembrane receptor protein
MKLTKIMITKTQLSFFTFLALSSSLTAAEIALDAISVTADAEEELLSDKKTKHTAHLAKHSKGETLGDFLEEEQFIDSASYGPAVGRPVIKGMDGYRVGITNGNIILNDLSAMSQDHAVGVMPRASQKIEIIKGPSSLLYGNYSGGVIHVLGEEHEDHLLEEGVSADISTQYGSNGAGLATGGVIKVSENNISLYANTFYSDAENYKDGAGQEVQDSDTSSLQSHLVLGYQLDKENIIKAYGNYLTKEYGIPNSTDERTSIEMAQSTYGVVWHNKELFDGLERLQTELRYSDYLHSELEGDRDDGLFGQKQLSASIHLDSHYEDWIFELHTQYTQSDLQVCHEHGKCDAFRDADRTSIEDGIELKKNIENFGIPFAHGHPMPNINEKTSQLGLNALTFLGDDTEFSSTLRFEYRDLTPDSVNIQEEWLVVDDIDPNYYDSTQDSALSFSTGLIGYFTDTLSYQSSIGYIERLPSSTEMFWNGFHHATDSYIFGDRYLKNEESINFDLTLMHQMEKLTSVIGGFYYHFNNYIFQEPLADEDGELIQDPFHHSDVWQVKGVAAKVYGVALKEELKQKYTNHELSTTLSLEAIRGELEDGGNIPRMSPYNASLEFGHKYKTLSSLLKYKYVDKSRYEAENETHTPAYSWLSLYIDHTDKYKYGEYSIYFKGENLTNELAYNHLSFLKDSAPLAGRQLTLGVSANF